MLILSRAARQSVVIGDAITMTVERIAGVDDGQRVSGATVRFGFEAPRYVSVCRNELLPKPPRPGKPTRVTQRRPRQPGQIVGLSGVVILLRIQVPRKVPVAHNGTRTVGVTLDEGDGGPRTVHHITCHKHDRITICNNIGIAILNFQRFICSEPAPSNAVAETGFAADDSSTVSEVPCKLLK